MGQFYAGVDMKVGRGLTRIFQSHRELVDKKSRCGTFVYHIHLDAYRGGKPAPVYIGAALPPGRGATEAGSV